nr:NEDD8-conjugating enzyme Ubc12-like [Tanacetum cinerariifolium]
MGEKETGPLSVLQGCTKDILKAHAQVVMNVTYVDNSLVLIVECGVVCLNLSLIVFVCFLDISELNLPKTCSIKFANGKDDLINFQVTVKPDEGYYLGGKFTFTFQIATIYPHEAPKVYHPNIDLDGNVCLNILREDWKPVLNINTVIYGLYHLFTQKQISLE